MPTELEKIRASGDGWQDREKRFIKGWSEEFVLSPDHWALYKIGTHLDWTVEKFDTASAGLIPNNRSGVYTFLVQPGIANHPQASFLCYVGKAERQSFRRRFRQYLREKGSSNPERWHIRHMLNEWKDQIWFCYAPIDDPALINDIEEALIASYLPPFNRKFTGTVKVPMRIMR